MPQISSYRRLWARPCLRRAAVVPCLFIPLDLARGVIPFETLERSRRDPLGPRVEMFPVDFSDVFPPSIPVKHDTDKNKKDRLEQMCKLCYLIG